MALGGAAAIVVGVLAPVPNGFAAVAPVPVGALLAAFVATGVAGRPNGFATVATAGVEACGWPLTVADSTFDVTFADPAEVGAAVDEVAAELADTGLVVPGDGF